MKFDAPIIASSLLLALGSFACDPSDSPYDDAFDEVDELDDNDGDALDLTESVDDDDEPMDPETMDEPTEPEPPVEPDVDAFMQDLDPTEIIDGFTIDSDRDVLVTNNAAGGICTGTLLRNNVVLTARHCVTTDGTINGPLAGAASLTATQDGPGATMGNTINVAEVVAMGTRDVAMLRLSNLFAIDGSVLGQSTQMLVTPEGDLEGNNVLCQGYGRNSCGGGSGTLRGGLVNLEDVSGGMIEYQPINGYDWIQYKGDSGSSCRLSALMTTPNLNKMLGVLSTAGCGWIATETGPSLYRDWAVDQMNGWAGDFFDNFSGWGFYTVDEPAGMIQGPSNWTRSGGVLTENSNAYTNTTYHEGTRYVNTVQVADDAIVKVTVNSADNDAAGLVLRYRDDTHYYRFSVDEQRRYARIVRRSGNGWTVLAEDLDFDIDWSTGPELAFYAWGSVLFGLVDGQIVLGVADDDPYYGYTSGRAGIYTWGLTNATFDDFEIDRF